MNRTPNSGEPPEFVKFSEQEFSEQQSVARAMRFVRERLEGRQPRVGLILGSGLKPDSLELEDPVAVTSIPGLPTPTVSGHEPAWVLGRCGGRELLVLGGRVHPYEGQGMRAITRGLRVLVGLGVERLILTNAAGGIHEDLAPGDLMRIEGHLNLLFSGPVQSGSEVSATHDRGQRPTYDPKWGQWLDRAAQERELSLASGVYAACMGPSYETPAEIRMLESWGADAVGMSTAHEAILASDLGLGVLGVSLITNPAAGKSPSGLSHDEVLEVGKAGAGRLSDLVSLAAQYEGPPGADK